MKLERRKIADLYTDPANARRHGPKNLETIKASLRRFGQQHPLVVNPDGMVVAGNGRLVAMGALGWTECDVVVTELTGLDLAAFGVADNRTAELAEWDADALAVVLEALRADDDLSPEDVGFDPVTMAAALEAVAGVDGLSDISPAGGDVDKIPDEQRSPIHTMTFTVHEDFVEEIDRALAGARDRGATDGVDESLCANWRGRALLAICRESLV